MIEPRGLTIVTGRQLELDLVATGLQLRMHTHDRDRVPGCVALGDDRDEPLRRIPNECAQLIGAVERTISLGAPGWPAERQTPGLIVGEMQMQNVELVEREKVDHPSNLLQRQRRPRDVERQTAPRVPRHVQDSRRRQRDLPSIR